MKKRTRLRVMLCGGLFGLLPACKSNPPAPPQGVVSDQLSSQMLQLGIDPVFPPRSDLQVGDIYMSCGDTGAASEQHKQLDHQVLWLASLPGIVSTSVGGQPDPGMLAKQYQTRMQVPIYPVALAVSGTAGAANPAAPPGAAPAPAAKPKKGEAKEPAKPATRAEAAAPPPAAGPTSAWDIFAEPSLKTVKPVSMPEFFTVSATRAQAQALVPFPSILTRAGLSYSKAEHIEISVSGAESYGIPGADIYHEYMAEACGGHLSDAFYAYNWYRNHQGNGGFCKYGTPGMVVIYEIYATRAINVSVTFSQETSGQAAAGLYFASGTGQATVLGALSKLQSPAPASSPSGASDANAGRTLVPTPASGVSAPAIGQTTAYVQQLNELYIQLVGSNGPQQYPGVQVSFINGNGSGVVMNRQFDSPMVIGYRALRIEPPPCAASGASSALAASSANAGTTSAEPAVH